MPLRHLFAIPGLVLVLLFSPAVLADLRIASWNIQNLGWGEQKSYPALAGVASAFDFIAIQELMNAEGAERLLAAVEEHTGESWSMQYSHALGRDRYREKYAFLWRDSAVEYVDGAVVYLDTTDRFAREPYSARFRSRHSGETFVAATVHITYGQRVSDRTPEVKALAAYWDWLREVYPEDRDRLLLMGDFNLAPGHAAWAPLKAKAEPLITHGATTLSTTDGQYANLYDNLWVGHDSALDIREAGIVRFPEWLDWSHKKARRHVSDHAPVFALTGSAALAARHVEATTPGTGCIDLNEADRHELKRLPHVGPARADAIIDGRPWGSVDELTRVHGLGPARVEEIRADGQLCGTGNAGPQSAD